MSGRNKGPFDFGVWAQCIIMGPFVILFVALTDGFMRALNLLVASICTFGAWYLLRRKAWDRAWERQS